MVGLSITPKKLILDATDAPELLQGSHRLLFRTAGFSVTSDGTTYELPRPPRLELVELLEEVVEYLIEEGVTLKFDEQVEKIIAGRQASKQAFEHAMKAGTEAKSIQRREIELPTMIRALTPFQDLAVHHLITVRHGANFSVPGSGKTTVIYAVLDILRHQAEVEKL